MAGLATSQQWAPLTPDPAAEKLLERSCGVTPLVARIMAARGISDVQSARAFLAPSLERDWADPACIPGMLAAADRIEAAIRAHEKIAIFGDFDVDGMSATCLLAVALRYLGATATPFIPRRFDEGYGLSRAALERLMSSGVPDLIVTVDNGIAAAEEVAWLKEQGIDVVITDHHEPADLVPQGVAVADPKLMDGGPSHELAGAGVALKLVQELGQRWGDAELWRRFTEVATLGTISDMMQLTGENRALVADGMRRMQHSARPGIRALAEVAGVNLATITSDELPFSLVPRLNAAGRMGKTEVAFDLLMCEDTDEARQLAAELEKINQERRSIESALTEEALARAEESFTPDGHVIVVAGEGWHEGVKGIVASRLVNRFHVPVLLFSVTDGIAKGSGRSVGSVDLFHAVSECSDLLVRFGGHEGAVGVTLEAEKLDAFRARMEEVLAALPAEQFIATREVDAVVSLDELTIDTINSLEVLQPFGQGNKKPMLAATGVSMRNRSLVGADHTHLRFLAAGAGTTIAAIMFRVPEPEAALAYRGMVDLVFEPVVETWHGRSKPKLMVRDILYRLPKDAAEPPATEKAAVPGTRAAASAPAASADAAPASAPTSSAELTRELCRTFIGERSLRPAQEAALERLAAGHNVLCIMATGRGKSLIFHVHAARVALERHQASIFIYPLRALVADQHFHLEESFRSLGLEVAVLTGESTPAERDEIFARVADGSVNVVLTTPEFFVINSARFVATQRIGFVVVDEAHHAGLAKSGQRSSYLELDQVLEALGRPEVLAVSATVPDEVAREICRLASISEDDVVVDDSCRENLELVDVRETRERDAELARIVATGGKTVAYVNSRAEAARLVRSLRRALPEAAYQFGFYHAGLTRADRLRIEQAFRTGKLRCIVATSAFGEGVDLPDIRHVVLYHLPFGPLEFNQMAGRAGRDGDAAEIHVLYGVRDRVLDAATLSAAAPPHEALANFYRYLRWSAKQTSGICTMSDAELAAAAEAAELKPSLTEAAISSGLAIFRELGFLNTSGYGDTRAIHMVSQPAPAQLEQSSLYLEGLSRAAAFDDFADWALTAAPDELLSHINRPLVPHFGIYVDESA